MKTLLAFYQTHKKALLLLFATWGAFFFALFIRVIEFKADGLHAGHVNVWSDWSLHIGMASIFAYKDPQYWFAYHPMYAGGKLNYAFLTNFISGMLMRAGFSIYFAFIAPSIIYSMLLLTGMYALFYLILKSKKQAMTAIFCFFLSSGMGFIKFFRDISHNYKLERLLYPEPAMDYSRLQAYQWYTGNFVVGMLMPQRSFLLGMAIAVWSMAGLIYVLFKEKIKKKDRIILVISGLLVGLLTIAHPHSLLVVFFVSAPLCVISFKRWRDLLYYVIPATVGSISLYLTFLAGAVENPNFITWLPGWTATGGLFGWIAMWLKIWGIMLPIAIFGFFLLRKQSLIIKSFFFSFFVVFLIGNLFQLQPVSLWDNSKLFLWSYFGFSGLAAVALSWCWSKGGKNISRIDVILVAVALTLTGFLELIRLQSIERNQPQMTSWDEIHLGQEIRKKTHPLAIFLTAPAHNHFVMMWGVRPILLGDIGWVRTYGFLPDQTEKDVKIMFQGGTDAETLLKRYKVSYVVIGPSELHDLHANESYYAQKYVLAFQNQHYRVYDVRSQWAPK